MIVAFAGRRVDRPGAGPVRFPVANVELVEQRIAAALRELGAQVLVAAAASGADLLALDAATAAGMRTHIVLPRPVHAFRSSSVADQPGDWPDRYDAAVAAAQARGDLEVMSPPTDANASVYELGNRAILAAAQRLSDAAGGPVTALVAWDGQRRGEHDYTADFAAEAARRGWPLRTVSTC